MIRILPLGGLGEIGMNCLAIEQNGEVLLIDCGVTFTDKEYGIDVVHPDFSVLDHYEGKIRGLVVTHGHEDHIGAVPYLLKRFSRSDIPIYAPRYALELIKTRLSEHDLKTDPVFHQTSPRERYRIGKFDVEPIRVTHSIADATALSIRAQGAHLLHTGDFKFDDSVPPEEAFDLERLEELGFEGIDLLLSDSTNIDNTTHSDSEGAVSEGLRDLISSATSAVVVSLFSSNVHRLRALGSIAQKTKRKILLLGRSMKLHVELARRLGHLDWPDALLWPMDRIHELRRDAMLLLATGSQAEDRSALKKLSVREGGSFALEEGDSVLFSSRVIPGHEVAVANLMDDLLRLGAKLYTHHDHPNIHATGHACREEQSRMITLTEPKAFVPLHGTLRHLMKHAELASGLGVPSVSVLENGQDGFLDSSSVLSFGKGFHSGRTAIAYGSEVSALTRQERIKLASGGVVGITLAIDPHGRFLRDPKVQFLGIAHAEVHAQISKRIASEVRAQCTRAPLPRDEENLREDAKHSARRVCFKELGYKPEVMVAFVK